MSTDKPMEGLTAIVTGAAGGVGSEVVSMMVERGARVVAEDVDPAVAEMESAEIAPLIGDVNDPATAPAAVALAQERFGGLDVLVNNAAKFALKPTLDTTDEEWDELMAINVRSVFRHCKAALPTLQGSRGAIVNMASTSGLTGAAGQLTYSATKGAIVQITRVLAVEFAPDVRVNAVAPGAIETGFVNAALAGIPAPEEAKQAVAALHPAGRFATPREIAEVVAFVASPAASFVTGAIISADGGYTAQ